MNYKGDSPSYLGVGVTLCSELDTCSICGSSRLKGRAGQGPCSLPHLWISSS